MNNDEELFEWFRENMNQLHADFVERMINNQTFMTIFSSQAELGTEDEKFTVPVTLVYAVGNEAIALNNFAKMHMLIKEESKD